MSKNSITDIYISHVIKNAIGSPFETIFIKKPWLKCYKIDGKLCIFCNIWSETTFQSHCLIILKSNCHTSVLRSESPVDVNCTVRTMVNQSIGSSRCLRFFPATTGTNILLGFWQVFPQISMPTYFYVLPSVEAQYYSNFGKVRVPLYSLIVVFL